MEPVKIIYHSPKFGGHRHSGNGDVLRLSSDLARLRDQSVKWLNDLEPLKISHHPTNFGSHRYCGSGNITILVCHVISQGHGIGVMWFNGREPLMVIHHPAKFGSHRHWGSGDMFVLVGLVVLDPTCPLLDPPLLFISKAHCIPCSRIKNFRPSTR